jgi:lysozyme
MNPDLRARLMKAFAGGALAIAAVLIGHFEGNRYTPYRDTGGLWTVCRGHTGSDVVPGRLYSEHECLALQTADMEAALAGVNRVIHVPLNDWQTAALIDFTFNVGEPALRDSTMAKLFNDGDTEGGCKQLARWVKARVQGRQ